MPVLPLANCKTSATRCQRNRDPTQPPGSPYSSPCYANVQLIRTGQKLISERISIFWVLWYVMWRAGYHGEKKMSFSCKRNDSALLLNGGSANVLSEKSQETAAAGVEGHLPEAPLFRCRFRGQWNSRLVTKRRRGAWVFAVPRGAEGGDSEAIKFLWLKLL